MKSQEELRDAYAKLTKEGMSLWHTTEELETFVLQVSQIEVFPNLTPLKTLLPSRSTLSDDPEPVISFDSPTPPVEQKDPWAFLKSVF